MSAKAVPALGVTGACDGYCGVSMDRTVQPHEEINLP